MKTEYDENELFPDHELVYVVAGESTKVCPKCGCTSMATFQTLYRKVCAECPTQVYWGLDFGQEPLL